MAWTAKLTFKRGKTNDPTAIVKAAGSSESQSDTFSINIDATNLSKGEFLTALDDVKAHVMRNSWPLN